MSATRIELLRDGHAAAAVVVVRRAIEATEGREYSAAQVEVWLAEMNEHRFREMLESTMGFGAFDEGGLVGLATFVEAEQRLDFLYVDPAAWRLGVARLLVEEVESHARSLGFSRVRVDASRLARAALVRMGYEVGADNRKQLGGVVFDNVWLQKAL